MTTDHGRLATPPGSSQVEPQAGLDPSDLIPIARRHLASSMRIYRTHAERAALRGGLGDAAALCDALARDIAAENRGRGGKGAVTKLGLQLEAIATRCGDAIWEMREFVTMPEDRDSVDLREVAIRVHRAIGKRGSLAEAEAFVALALSKPAQGIEVAKPARRDSGSTRESPTPPGDAPK